MSSRKYKSLDKVWNALIRSVNDYGSINVRVSLYDRSMNFFDVFYKDIKEVMQYLRLCSANDCEFIFYPVDKSCVFYTLAIREIRL